MRRIQQLVKSLVAVRTSQQGIGQHVGIRAIVLVDCCPEHVKGGTFLAGMDELKQVGDIFRVVLDRQKTGTHINNVIPAWLGEELLKVKNGNPEYFFWTGLTTPEDAPSYFHKLYRRAFKAAGVEGSSHHFRHTYAIELLKAGIDIRTVQKALGHSSLGTTEKYYSRWNLAQQDLMDASLQGVLAGK